MRPERNAVTGDRGFAASIEIARDAVGLPPVALGDIKTACLLATQTGFLTPLVELRAAAAQPVAAAAQRTEPTRPHGTAGRGIAA